MAKWPASAAWPVVEPIAVQQSGQSSLCEDGRDHRPRIAIRLRYGQRPVEIGNQ
ncbi:hypothetical protein [Ensifer canadensis]|uniref:hypothetical protein n=1 Tax=Ensifer canadensis TaxID=555315 RepID=UPI00149080EE|nr:hypothetical protein [Ensifer canadensis]